MSDKNLTPQQRWQKKNQDIVRKSKAKYDSKNPVWGIRPDEELRKWLEEERWDDENGKPESNSALVIRKLRKLMKLERQGY